MNIFIVTLGSRGDVQPYIALGKGLQAAGHAVTVCTSVSFEPFITEHGLRYGYMSDEFMKLMESAEGHDAIENTTGVFGSIKTMMKLMKEANRINRELMKDTWAAAQEAEPDLIIYHPKALSGAHIAEKLRIPVMLAVPAPAFVPTAEIPVVGLPDLNLGRWYNRLGYALINQGYRAYDGLANEFRQQTLGLGKIKQAALPRQNYAGEPIPVLHCISQHVLPRPTDWPSHATMNGYWFLDRANDWQPSAELQAFLDAGDPPVYVGFGSMAGRNPEKLARTVIAGLQQAGVRGVIATGWGGLAASDLPETIFKIDQAPHDWLFPRMAAVVHHGGAGTTAAGLRAGRPTGIVTFIADQPLWGKRVHDLGVGTESIPHKKLTPDNLAAAIREMTTNPSIRRSAEALGEKLRAEDGVGDTVNLIERMGTRTEREMARV
ncbi:MAG: glycosyltransferase family 1 protein [Anaerolineae bacterium]|nr:glycosyltransferase family 1 protein [Anaerolineae bacterium]